MTTRCILFLLILMAALLPVGGCSGDSSPPNVILITFDTLRADHLGCYGYGRDTSPNIDSFAASSTLYSHSFASSPWTLPSHASIFTGLDPARHGARTFETETQGNNVNPLDDHYETLAEAFTADGYRAGAIVANDGYLDARWGVDQGFASYDVERMLAAGINAKVYDWLARNDQERFFLFINYMDTHRPYDTTPRPGFSSASLSPDSEVLLDRLIEQVMPGTGQVSAALAQAVISQYDTAIANLDEEFGRLIAHLEARGLLDNTIVVVTSDHGEFFGEHHLVEHSKDVYQEVLQVPLVFRLPGQQQGDVKSETVSSTDLPGMILEACGLDAAAERFPHRPGNHPVVSSNWYTRSKDLYHPVWGHRFRRVRHVLFDWPNKYIESSDGSHELYDLTLDPVEKVNRVEASRSLAAKMQAALAAAITAGEVDESFSPEELDEATKRRLRSLGYISD